MYGTYPQPVAAPTGFQNPYLERLMSMQPPVVAPQSQQAPMMPRYDIIHVNGENGARAFRMAPNSQCLLLDDTAPIVWLCISDGAGYHTVNPYTIAPYQPEPVAQQQVLPAPDYTALEERISRLEARVNESNVTDVRPTNRKNRNADGPDTNAGSK